MSLTSCPCGSQQPFASCCEPYILGKRLPTSPEALMRSRFSAFVVAAWPYLVETWHPDYCPVSDAQALARDSQDGHWLKLQVVASKVQEDEQQGTVLFLAWYRDDSGIHAHHEESRFEKLAGRWVYTTGRFLPVPKALQIGPNSPCPCGSGKKLKKCDCH